MSFSASQCPRTEMAFGQRAGKNCLASKSNRRYVSRLESGWVGSSVGRAALKAKHLRVAGFEVSAIGRFSTVRRHFGACRRNFCGAIMGVFRLEPAAIQFFPTKAADRHLTDYT